MKRAAEWFYEYVYKEEAIPRRVGVVTVKLPPPLQAARSLQNKPGSPWQSREAVFLKQAKLLAAYEDDYVFRGSVMRYYPTYESLDDDELRGYFSWRTKLRRGELTKTSTSFAYLYIYELLNQIGVENPMEGYETLQQFRREYGELDESILPYLDAWLTDYVVYYNLDAGLLETTRQAVFDRHLAVLSDIPGHTEAEVIGAVKTLAPRWLGRSRFYAQNQADMDRVIVRVLDCISRHYAARCKKTMVEQYFGAYSEYPIRLFASAVFVDRQKPQNRDYAVDSLCIYRCRGNLWTVQKYSVPRRPSEKLEDLMKTVDCIMRQLYGDKHPIQMAVETKWIEKHIREEVQRLLDEKKAAEVKKLAIDYSALAKIRQDAAVTRDKLIVEEEIFEEEEPEIEAVSQKTSNETPLSDPEYRLLQSLLYGRELNWVQAEGHLLSVLVDGINEKLYDDFCDSVLELDSRPELIEDYIEQLKEMVHP